MELHPYTVVYALGIMTGLALLSGALAWLLMQCGRWMRQTEGQ